METLLDTVPVERERAWANQCQTSHQRLMAMFGELNTAFAQLGTTASREEEAKRDLSAEDEIKELWKEVEGTGKEIRDRQAERLGQLTTDHGEVVKVIMNAINAGGGAAQSAFTTLGRNVDGIVRYLAIYAVRRCCAAGADEKGGRFQDSSDEAHEGSPTGSQRCSIQYSARKFQCRCFARCPGSTV